LPLAKRVLPLAKRVLPLARPAPHGQPAKPLGIERQLCSHRFETIDPTLKTASGAGHRLRPQTHQATSCNSPIWPPARGRWPGHRPGATAATARAGPAGRDGTPLQWQWWQRFTHSLTGEPPRLRSRPCEQQRLHLNGNAPRGEHSQPCGSPWTLRKGPPGQTTWGTLGR